MRVEGTSALLSPQELLKGKRVCLGEKAARYSAQAILHSKFTNRLFVDSTFTMREGAA